MAVILAMGAPARADDSYISQNISGFNLPGVQLPQGHDEVRAADGTTCRSAVSGSGAYLDVGIIGNPEQANTSASFQAYGRMVVPLGRAPARLDCSQLYELEVQRLAIELKLVQMGLSRGIAPTADASQDTAEAEEQTESGSEKAAVKGAAKPVKTAAAAGDWDDEGWTTDGRKKN
jgi:hypothetical protein